MGEGAALSYRKVQLMNVNGMREKQSLLENHSNKCCRHETFMDATFYGLKFS